LSAGDDIISAGDDIIDAPSDPLHSTNNDMWLAQCVALLQLFSSMIACDCRRSATLTIISQQVVDCVFKVLRPCAASSHAKQAHTPHASLLRQHTTSSKQIVSI
jgi:hypothetical protein